MDNESQCWQFNFVLDSCVPANRQHPQDLLEQIVKWAEGRFLQMGGGFRECVEAQTNGLVTRWEFSFAVETKSGQALSKDVATALFEQILDWGIQRSLDIRGGIFGCE
ncbi:MAG: hypothetical protein KDB14_30390 [Planctomycetales bacterium]|nr:hypothetical protein [Planctomycetales bacterium]